MTRLLTIFSLTLLLAPANAEDPSKSSWTQWRGPERDGTVDAAPWPNDFENLKQAWRIKAEPSYSGPIIVGDKVFTTETKDKKLEVVRALDRKTGKEIWSTQWEGSLSVPFFARSNGSWIRSTPAYSDGKLYVAGIRDVLVCLDAKTGKIDWKVNFVERYKSPVPSFGFVCSPFIDGDALYVQAGASFLKMDKKTGKEIWRSLKDGGGMFGSAFSSPVKATLKDQEQLLVQTRTALTGIDPKDGDVLWSRKIQAFRGMNILTPSVFEGKVLTSAYGGQSHLISLDKKDDNWSSEFEWSVRIQGYMSSPVIIDGHAYLHLRNQRFCCIDLKTGKEKWRTDRSYGKYWSMVANKDKILALDERGDLYLIKANPEKLELLAKKKVSEQECWAHLAVVGDELYIRELRGMMRLDWK